MKITVLLLVLASFAFSNEIYHETSNFKVKLGKVYRGGSFNYEHCKYQVYRNDDGKMTMRMGVVGSPVDHFGWDVSFEDYELPLKAGFSKIIVSGMVKMQLSYDGKLLTYKPIKQKKIWNRIYPFSIQIDENLDNPGKMKASSEGFQTTFFGLTKHIVQTCKF